MKKVYETQFMKIKNLIMYIFITLNKPFVLYCLIKKNYNSYLFLKVQE